MQALLVGIVGAAFLGVVFILAILQAIWSAWWLYPAWDWFIVPLGLPPISMWHFMALFVIARHKMPELQTRPKEREERTWIELAAYYILIVTGPIISWAWLKWLNGGFGG